MELDKWKDRIGKFCIIDYKTPNGTETTIGELIDVTQGGLLLIKNLNNDEETEVSINNIENSKIREKRQ